MLAVPGRGAPRLLVSVVFVVGFAGPGFAQSLPTGGAVAAGAATIATPSGTSLVVTQTSRNAIINWGSFSVGQGNRVAFQNGSGATLNRVVGNVPSRLDGTITATGSLFLVNPAGVAIGTTGRIATGGSFLASTLDVPDADFMKGGDLTFKGASTASVVNYGEIGSLGGDVALIARKVENAGTIDAPNGTAALAAGYEVLVRDGDLDGGKFVVKVGGADTEAKTSGKIRAAAVELRANGGNVYALAGNTDGIVAATGTASKGGRIFLTAGDAGTVKVSQKVVARSASGGGKAKGGAIRVSGKRVDVSGTLDARGDGDAGGSIVVSGETIALASTARLDASGTSGGTVLVGGDYQGGRNAATKYLTETVATAKTVDVASGATIAADGSLGAGGKVVVWSDEYTTFLGAITATGARVGGDAEVSGKAVLDYRGTADLRAASGRFGTLLLDPYNLTISNASSSGMSGFTANADDSVLNVTTLTNALATANVTVTTGSSGSQAGNITVADAVTWTSGSTLTLSAYGNITISAAFIATSGGLTLSPGASGTISANAAIDVATYLQTAGTFSQVAGTLPAFTAGDFRITGGTFLRATAGDGSNGNPYLITDVYGLQGIGSAGMLAKSFALAGDIDASGTSNWNGGAGFVPIGNNVTQFTGTFDGQGHVVSGLVINLPSAYYVGMFGYIGTGSTVRNVGLVSSSVEGYKYVGGLVGYNTGTITRSYTTGAVTAETRAGNLAGYNNGTITLSYATGNVTGVGTDRSRIGGLVGTNDTGIISDSYATGTVNGFDRVGGLIGLINQFGGTITRVFASGQITGTTNVGGLVGKIDAGTVTNAFWDREATGQSSGIGSGSVTGVTGLTTAQATDPFTFINAGWDFTSVWGKSITGANSGYMMLRPLSSGLYDDYVSLSGATSKIYGAANPALSGINLSGVGTAYVTLAWASRINTATNVGIYNYSQNVVTVADGQGRSVYVDYGSDALTVNKATVTVALRGPVTKIYDGTISASLGSANFSLTGIVKGDAVTLTSPTSGTYARADVGSDLGVTASGLSLTGPAVANYQLATTTISANVGSIAAAPLTVSANNAATTYDGSAFSGGNGVAYSGFVNSEGPSVLGGNLSYGGASQGAVNAGTYAIVPSGLTSTNYALIYQAGSLTIGQRAITVTANNQTMTAGGSVPGLTWSVTNGSLARRDSLSGALATAATAASPPGAYAIFQGTLGTSANYALAYVPGVLTVTVPPFEVLAALAATPNRFVETSASNATVVFTTSSTTFTATGSDSGSAAGGDPTTEDGSGCAGGATASSACTATPHPENRRVGRFLTFSVAAPWPTVHGVGSGATTIQ